MILWSFLGSIILGALATPAAIRLALHFGLVDRPARHKFHSRPTPYLGGLAVVLPVLGALAVAAVTTPAVSRQIVAIAVGGVLVAAVGLLDDFHPLQPLPRVAAQACAAIPLWAAGIRLAPFSWAPVDLALTVVVVVAVTNSVNLLDNMDGLSSGTVAIAAAFIAILAERQGQHLTPIVAAALAGGCLGFLPYNFQPARIFLGDAGTLFMGFVLAALLIKLDLHQYPVLTRTMVPLVIAGVPLLDTALVTISRSRAGRPLFRGGTDHSSHRLVAAGLSPRRAVLLTYATGVACGAVAVALLEMPAPAAAWSATGAIVAAALALLATLERLPALGQAHGGPPRIKGRPDERDARVAPPLVSVAPAPSIPAHHVEKTT